MKVKDVLMTCSYCAVIMKGNDELLGISTCYFNKMLSENLLESVVKKVEPDGNRTKIWLESEESQWVMN